MTTAKSVESIPSRRKLKELPKLLIPGCAPDLKYMRNSAGINPPDLRYMKNSGGSAQDYSLINLYQMMDSLANEMIDGSTQFLIK
jgi:hypothetical protein